MNLRSVPKRRASPLALLLCAPLLATLLAGCGAGRQGSETRTVAVAKAVRRHLSNSMTFQGEFTPYQDVMIHAKVSGYVNPIRVDIGDRVKAGDLLATLEVPELHNQLEAAVASARRAEAEHAIAHLDYERLSGVNQSHPNLVAQQELDDAQSKDVSTAAAMAAAAAEADRLRSLSDYTRVTAPFTGVITKRFVDNGTLVGAGTSSGAGPLVELAQSDLLRLRFPVPESVTPLLHAGRTVSVSVDALQRTFQATVTRDAWEIDRSTRTMVTEVDIPNTDGTFKAGMYASVTLETRGAQGVLSVPLQALSHGETPTILVVNRDNVLEERRVEVGMRTASLAEIKSGLSEGDWVVVGERSGLEPGVAVLPKATEVTPD